MPLRGMNRLWGRSIRRFCLEIVAMTTFLELSEREGQNDGLSTTIYLPFGENFVKSGPVRRSCDNWSPSGSLKINKEIITEAQQSSPEKRCRRTFYIDCRLNINDSREFIYVSVDPIGFHGDGNTWYFVAGMKKTNGTVLRKRQGISGRYYCPWNFPCAWSWFTRAKKVLTYLAAKKLILGPWVIAIPPCLTLRLQTP